jgi:hypothetical protein
MDYGKQASAAKQRRGNMMAAASEESFYRQHEILQRELDGLRRGRPGVVDVFLVGVAGYGGQDVFMREVDSVSDLFRERFDADGHIVKLVNNPKRVLTDPVASVTSLEAALKRRGRGDGSRRGRARALPHLPRLGRARIHRAALAAGAEADHTRDAARDAGCERDQEPRRRRVGLLRRRLHREAQERRHAHRSPPAAPDRNSFGCSNENDWTYFGKAYFDEGLRQTTSFTQAFEIAKPLIEERERREKYDPSNPQMSLGSAIKVKLEELERQLSTRAVPAPG